MKVKTIGPLQYILDRSIVILKVPKTFTKTNKLQVKTIGPLLYVLYASHLSG